MSEEKYDIRRVVKGLMYAFPTVRYVAFNPSITEKNLPFWRNQWYIAAFKDAPYLQILDGFSTWVAKEEILFSKDEEAVFFLHFSSPGYYLDDKPLQSSPDEFISTKELCFTLDEDGNVVQFKDQDHIKYFKV